MANLNEIAIPRDADDALIWAIGRESELRDDRYRTVVWLPPPIEMMARMAETFKAIGTAMTREVPVER